MGWPTGFSWTRAHDEVVTNPDGTHALMHVHGGPFYYNPRLWGICEVYAGFRPTAPWAAGYGDEGWFGFAARWLKRKGWGNLGFARRRAKRI